ncbi:hypothetical protein [Gracilibacillus timonensis]|uniref:hypothetical protein n=1 Tax=Gracilibacillus timonensis TaxID=1816696 RepID=UPI0008243163|nr:hypothetical protein [Gracilibacillus timonensis]
MEKVIIADPNRIRLADAEKTLVADSLDEVGEEGKDIYISSSLLAMAGERNNVHVYFELECYPFFDKVRNLIGQQVKPKGVLRYRRKTKKDINESLLIEDMAVICSFFGDTEHVFTKRSKQKHPYHVIITLNFGGGTMAHVEYTVTNKDQIELEWSGVGRILEFDSDEMNPFMSNGSNIEALSLGLNTKTILDRSYFVDVELLETLDKYCKLIKAGDKK